MDLFAKIIITTIAVVFVLGIVFGVVLLLYHATPKPLTKAQAEGLILKDMEQAYPNANLSLISASRSNLTNDSWNVVINVAYNYSRACPEVVTEGFDYPAVNLVPSDEILYSSGCRLYGFGAAPNYIITNPYIAMVRAYDSNNSAIMDYVSNYTYNNTNVYARFYSAANPELLGIGINSTDSWVIEYTSPNSKSILYALMKTSGNVVSTTLVNATQNFIFNSTG